VPNRRFPFNLFTSIPKNRPDEIPLQHPVLPNTTYRAEWFDPRTSQWAKAGDGTLQANFRGWLEPPDFPSHDDWGLKLTAVTAKH